jgi:hypothetical protein
MTVAVAVLCHRSTGGGFMAADRRLSMPNGGIVTVNKICAIGPSTLVAFAGHHDQTTVILQNVKARPGISAASASQIAIWISEERKKLANDLSEKRRVAIQHRLPPRLTSNPEFGTDDLPESTQLLAQISLELSELSLRADFLIMGNDNGHTMIATVEGFAGLPKPEIQMGAIGDGADYAWMCLERWSLCSIRGVQEAAYLAFEAKTMAERKISVGQETDMFGIRKTGEIVPVESQILRSFQAIYSERHSAERPLDEGEIRSIGDPFKPSATQG